MTTLKTNLGHDLNATPGTLVRLHRITRELTQDFAGFGALFARMLPLFEDAHTATLHTVRSDELVLVSRVAKDGRISSYGDDEGRLSHAGRIPPAAALQKDMAFIFSDGNTAFKFSTNREDYDAEQIQLITPYGKHQLLLPLYVKPLNEPPEKLGVLEFEGSDLFWNGSTCQTVDEKRLEIMLDLSLISTGISAKLEAGTDALTKLMRKKEFYIELNRVLNAIETGQTTDVSIVMVDIDYFKRVNDTHGHQVGDKVLGTVANILLDGIRGEQKIARKEERQYVTDNPILDILARYGGEEFAIIAITGIDGAVKMAERLRKSIESACADLGGGINSVTCSFGVASLSQIKGSREKLEHAISETGRLLLELADQALYEAKRLGRNCTVASGKEIGRPADEIYRI